MKKLLIIVLIALIPINLFAWKPDKWETHEIILQCIFVTSTTIDLMQTYTYLQKPGVEEINPITGKNPSKQKLLLIGISGIVIHTALVHISPRPIRFGLQTYFIGMEIFAISHNYYIGARIKF